MKEKNKPKKSDKKSVEKSEKLLDLCKKADDWYSYFSDHLGRARRILTFIDVDQWDNKVKSDRESLSKPVLTFNKLRPILNSIVGEQRAHSPQPTIRGISDKNNQNDIDFRTDLIRQISANSNADMVYETAFEGMVAIGWGWGKVGIDYENPETFKKCVYLQELDYQSGFADPAAIKPDKSDGEYGGTIILMSKEEYDRKYPDFPNPQDPGSYYYIQWNTRQVVPVADIWLKEYSPMTIVQLSDGREMEKEKANELIANQQSQRDAQLLSLQQMPVLMDELIEPLEIVNERTTKKCALKHYRFVRNHILEETDFPGEELPIVYFEGKSVVINGERVPLSYIEPAIDSQVFLNYIRSEQAHSILTSRKEQFLGTEENFEGYEDMYRNPQQVQGALYANPDGTTGQMPQIISPTPFNQALSEAAQEMSVDIVQSLGRPDELRGYQTNAISGDAIRRRQEAGKNPVNIYTDNLSRGIKQMCKVMLGLFPHVYAEDNREVNIKTAQGKVQKMILNKRTNRFTFNNDEIKEEIENNMTEGNYDIEIRVDGTFDEQIKDQLDALTSLYQVMPNAAPATIDLYGKLISIQDSHELVERLSTMLPSDIKALKEGKEPPPPQPNPMMMIEQGKLQAEMKNIELKQQEAQINAQVKMAEIEVSKEKLINERAKMSIEAQLQGIDASVAIEKANAEVLKTRIKSHAEIEKAHLDSGTAHITHATHRLKQMDKLISTKEENNDRAGQ
jgi:hypothetical protein